MTQPDRVYEYMVTYGGITQAEANKAIGVSRLSAIIFELKRKGIPIKSEWQSGTNRYNEQTRYKFYWIAGGQ